MRAEAACSVRFGHKTSTGKALLETSELIFRGEFRLVIPFSEIEMVDASDGQLKVTCSGGTATFELGAKAEQWARKIRNPKSIIDKLGIKPGHRVVVLDVADAGFMDQLRERGAAVSTRAVKNADAIFVHAETLAGLAGLRQLVAHIKRDGAIWTVTPKGQGGIKDTDVMGIGKAAGLVDVKVVSFSGTHAAHKFVIPKAVR